MSLAPDKEHERDQRATDTIRRVEVGGPDAVDLDAAVARIRRGGAEVAGG